MFRVLIIGAGDIAKRLLPSLVRRCQVYAVVRDVRQLAWWRDHGAIPLLADLDRHDGCRRLDGLLRTVGCVIYLAPPAETTGAYANRDQRLRRLLSFRASRNEGRILTRRWIYISTTGVYGDLAGGWSDETATCFPATLRARRRVDAEQCLRQFGAERRCQVSVLRVPGIYAPDRLPLARVSAGPVLAAGDDVFTNHIHADDLARIIVATMRRGRPNRVYNAVDDLPLPMSEYFDTVADAFELPRPRRVSREVAAMEISPAMLTYLSESRRLTNRRIKEELGVRLIYPDVFAGLCAARAVQNRS